MDTLAGRIATLALRTFDELPKKSKPRTHPNGSREWVPMSAVVLVHDANIDTEALTCIALATGCKCLPCSALPKCHGQVLHDSHAEILALRGLNSFLLSEISQVLGSECNSESKILCARSLSASVEAPDLHGLPVNQAQWPPFAIRSNISIHMFSTEAPCGDASMEILMSELGPNDSVPWQPPHGPSPITIGSPAPTRSLQGRSFFSNLGTVRRKPSRPDAEATLSKSCTDKLSIKQITSLLSFPTYHFIATTPNAYLSSLILPAEKYSEVGCTRAFSPSGRLSPLQNLNLPAGSNFHPFQVIALPQDFEPQFPFSKPPATPPTSPDNPPPPPPPTTQPNEPANPKPRSKPKSKASNISALYIHPPLSSPNPPPPINETLLSGLPQGHSLSSPPPQKPSAISRFRMLKLGREVTKSILLHPHWFPQADATDSLPGAVVADLKCMVEAGSYGDAKAMGVGGCVGQRRREAKGLVVGILGMVGPPGWGGGKGGEEGRGSCWPRNSGDDDWEIPSCSS